jgi:dephospho-CoA kinase
LWTRRPGKTEEGLAAIEKLALEHWGTNDAAIVNDGSIEALELQVGSAIARIRQAEEEMAP